LWGVVRPRRLERGIDGWACRSHEPHHRLPPVRLPAPARPLYLVPAFNRSEPETFIKRSQLLRCSPNRNGAAFCFTLLRCRQRACILVECLLALRACLAQHAFAVCGPRELVASSHGREIGHCPPPE